MGRVRGGSSRVRSFLNASATGILLFLSVDVLTKGVRPVELALSEATPGVSSPLHFAWLALVFVTSLALGLMSLVYYDRWLAHRAAERRFGPGAVDVGELRAGPIARLAPSHRLAFFIALGIGFHHPSEGLLIGQARAGSARRPAPLLARG